MSTKYNERLHNIENILFIKNLRIDQESLRGSCLYGVPDKFRPLAWRLFLGYLPMERQQWAQTLAQQRAYYTNLVENFVRPPAADSEEQNCQNRQNGHDHPLALEQNSIWTGYFKDNEVLKQIENDVRRLRPEIDFFQRSTVYPMKISQSLSKRVNNEFLAGDEGVTLNKLADKSFISPGSTAGHNRSSSDASFQSETGSQCDEKHWEVVERILYIYAKANSGVGYVQGMNELLGPIYYVFASDGDDEWARHAEADSFYCFQNLMSEMQDIFIKKLDGEHCGIEAALVHFYAHLEQNDPALYTRLVNEQQIKAEFFAFRWISLLLSQEFSLPDLIALWDHLFASKSGCRLQTVECLCLAMLEELRDQLLDGDFPTNLRILQNFPENFDVSMLISRSMHIAGGQTFQEFKEFQEKAKSKLNESNNVFASVKSRFTTPFKNLMADTSAKLAGKIGGSGGVAKYNKDGGKERICRDGQAMCKNATL